VTLCNLFDTEGNTAENVLSCVIRPALPPPDEWISGYSTDPTLKPIYTALLADPSHIFAEPFLRKLPSAYQAPLRDGLISLRHGRLTYTQPLSRNGRSLLLIIPPESLRRRLFEVLHSSPSAGHLMAYKTLHRIRLRFHWHKLRSDVETWLKACPDCILANTRIRRNSELVYSWPVSSPFAIIHVDIWQPGTVPAYNGCKHVLAAMCNLTSYSIIADLPSTDSATLAEYFMKHVLLRVGFCLLVAPDAGSPFFLHFKKMCEVLKISCQPALGGNHKSVHVERLFRFFNKAVAIAVDQRGGDARISSEVVHLANYAWNASPIDGTDIIRSVPAIGRPFRFPLDCDLTAIPDIPPADIQVQNLYEFLRLGQRQSVFSVEILRHLTEDRRLAAAHHANEGRTLRTFKVGDIVSGAVQVQSDAARGRVAKLSYRRRGPWRVLEVLQHAKYNVRTIYNDQAATIEVHGQDLELVPPSLWACEPSDGPDQRLLDIHVPEMPISLRRPLGCDSYNHHFFDSTDQPPPHPSSPPLPPSPLQNVPADTPLLHPTTIDPTLITTYPNPAALHNAILASADRLFFIAYRHQGALRPKYSLVQVDQTRLPQSPPTDGTYYCHFLTAPSSDATLPEQDRRWWPIWHRYRTAADGVIEYLERVEFKPTVTPTASKYIAWADTIPLLDNAHYLHGPFDFIAPQDATDRTRTPSFRQFVPTDLWTDLRNQCLARGVLPPTLSSTAKAPNRRSRRKRNSI
jgi:hypothetical protein